MSTPVAPPDSRPLAAKRKGRLSPEDVRSQAEAFVDWFLRQGEYQTTTAAFVPWADSKDFLPEDRGNILLMAQSLLGCNGERF